ncbi:MAG: hypothetical protein M3275_06605 [Thermoproteota archaeon]|nr:hypothetical protein [Thermoproteota archaeon]
MKTGQKTTTRTIRLPSKIDGILQKDAKEKRTTVNSLISTALTKYAEWDRYSESVGFINLPRNAFKLIIDSLDDEKIKRIAEETGARIAKELMMFIFKKITLDTFLSMNSLWFRYSGVGIYEIETNEREYTIVMHHELGRKWSTYLAHFASQALKGTLGVVPKFNITEHSVVIEFFIP